VVERIQFLVEKGLTSMMVVFDFLLKRITPLQQHACPAWLYIGENVTTRLERGRGIELDPKVLDAMLSKLSSDPISADFVNPPLPCMLIFLDQATRSKLLKEMPTLDNIDITVWQVGDAS
jgi:hypothetical protein